MSKRKFLEASLVAGALAAGLFLHPFNVMAGEDADKVLASGTLTGANGHVTTGGVTIVQSGGKTIAVLDRSFSLDGAPAPVLGFSAGGDYVEASEFSRLASLTGEQKYTLPADFDIAKYDTFTVWCSDFSVSLGDAPLKKN